MEKRKFGEILLDAGIIDEQQLEIALAEQKRTGGRLGRTLIGLGLVSEDEISHALASQTGVDHCDLATATIEPEAVRFVPEEMARRLQLIPLRIDTNGTLLVAMANPTDIVAIDEIERTADLFVRVVSGSRRQVMQAIDRAYAGRERREHALEESIARAVAEVGSGDLEPGSSGLVSLLEEILSAAIRHGATDVHFEPDEKVVRWHAPPTTTGAS